MRFGRSFLAAVVALGAISSSAFAALTASWQQVPISANALASDPTLANMQSWSLRINYTDGDWASGGIRATLPAGSFFYRQSPLGAQTYPGPALIAAFPALEFTSYVRAAADAAGGGTNVLGSFPEGSPDGPSVGNQTQAPPGTPGNFNASFGDLVTTPPGNYEIVRLTFPIGVIPPILPLSVTSQVNPSQDLPIPQIPEPGTLGLLAAAGLLAIRRRSV